MVFKIVIYSIKVMIFRNKIENCSFKIGIESFF